MLCHKSHEICENLVDSHNPWTHMNNPSVHKSSKGLLGPQNEKWQISGRCWAAMTPKEIHSRMLRGSSQEVGYNPSRSVDFMPMRIRLVWNNQANDIWSVHTANESSTIHIILKELCFICIPYKNPFPTGSDLFSWCVYSDLCVVHLHNQRVPWVEFFCIVVFSLKFLRGRLEGKMLERLPKARRYCFCNLSLTSCA